MKCENSRAKTINRAAAIGICCNVLLCAVKLVAGILSMSVSVIADALNNLSDIGSGAVTLIGNFLARRPADKKHPFGHGRWEYMSGLMVGLLILIVGEELLKSSVKKIINPTVTELSLFTAVALIIGVLVKLALFITYRRMNRGVDSAALAASAQDSINDVFTTTAVLISVAVSLIFSLDIDGYIGAAVSVYIIVSGVRTMLASISTLLGERESPKLFEELEHIVMQYEGFVGIHDVAIHSYGPGRRFISLHVEVPASADIMEIHDLIDSCEREAGRMLDCSVTIHMDPVDMYDEKLWSARQQVEKLIEGIDPRINTHDFRMVRSGDSQKLMFDIVVPGDIEAGDEELTGRISGAVKEIDPRYICVIGVDRSFE